MALSLRITQNNGNGSSQSASATIKIVNDAGIVEADVLVEIYEGVARLIVTPSIVARDSDAPTRVIDLITDKDLPI